MELFRVPTGLRKPTVLFYLSILIVLWCVSGLEPAGQVADEAEAAAAVVEAGQLQEGSGRRAAAAVAGTHLSNLDLLCSNPATALSEQCLQRVPLHRSDNGGELTAERTVNGAKEAAGSSGAALGKAAEAAGKAGDGLSVAAAATEKDDQPRVGHDGGGKHKRHASHHHHKAPHHKKRRHGHTHHRGNHDGGRYQHTEGGGGDHDGHDRLGKQEKQNHWQSRKDKAASSGPLWRLWSWIRSPFTDAHSAVVVDQGAMVPLVDNGGKKQHDHHHDHHLQQQHLQQQHDADVDEAIAGIHRPVAEAKAGSHGRVKVDDQRQKRRKQRRYRLPPFDSRSSGHHNPHRGHRHGDVEQQGSHGRHHQHHHHHHQQQAQAQVQVRPTPLITTGITSTVSISGLAMAARSLLPLIRRSLDGIVVPDVGFQEGPLKVGSCA